MKLTLDGKVEWTIEQAGRKAASIMQPADHEEEARLISAPTGIAVGPDGRIYVADGYGASVVHVLRR